MPWWGDILNRK